MLTDTEIRALKPLENIFRVNRREGQVEPGDQVIIRGGERLAPGQLVEIIPAAGAARQCIRCR